ncbi:MAG TPA: Rad52/Rad22 family DNA repair protein [Ktedonobacterales bacterium]|nr:Rad52/Rad22 family DNA repair protein [Ktedonobacterales bacterium]
MSDIQPTTPQSTALTREQWDDISRRLREPFDPREVDFRAQGRPNEQTGKAQVVAYIDARAVQDRLDQVVGPGAWSFEWEALVIEKGDIQVAKGILTIHGVSKADAGTASNFEQSLGAVSHCFKRAAVHWGIGRYLYSLPMAWVAVEKNGRIPEATLRELRARLPRPSAPTSATSATSAAPQAPENAPALAETATAYEAAPVAVGRPTSAPRQPRASAPRSSQPAANNTPTTTPAPQAAPTSGSLGSASATPPTSAAATTQGGAEPYATEQQLVSIRKLCAALNKPEPGPGVTYAQARQLITQLSGEYQRVRRAS